MSNSPDPKDLRDGVGIIVADTIDETKVTQILLMERGEGTRFTGQFENCGGSVEDGEEPEAAARRELREELGVEVNELKFLHSWPAGNGLKQDHLYIVTVSGEPTIMEAAQSKCVSLQWVSLPDLIRYPLTTYAQEDFFSLNWLH